MPDREEIIWNEVTKLIHEFATLKARDGLVLKPENINAAFVAFVAKYDLYVAFWNEEIGNRDRALAIRRSLKEYGDIVGNAVFVQDRATALHLHAACRASDNIAPDPPE